MSKDLYKEPQVKYTPKTVLARHRFTLADLHMLAHVIRKCDGDTDSKLLTALEECVSLARELQEKITDLERLYEQV